MKSTTVFRALTALSFAVLVTACDPKPKESVEVAKDVNDTVIEDRDEEKDADFIVNTMAGNYAEVKLAELALTRSDNAEVKETATMLKAQHTKIISELEKYAAAKGITVPTEETDEARKEYANLAEEKETSDFNKKWCDKLADKHEDTIDSFESRLNKTEDVDLKSWITATLPGLKTHLEALRANEVALK